MTLPFLLVNNNESTRSQQQTLCQRINAMVSMGLRLASFVGKRVGTKTIIYNPNLIYFINGHMLIDMRDMDINVIDKNHHLGKEDFILRVHLDRQDSKKE